MSEATTTAAEHADHAHDHPSDWEYVKIALILAVFTGVEVATYFDSVFTFFETRWVLITTLMVLMVIKFWLVARMFMHLKQDKKILSGMFATGLLFAGGVYIATLQAFRFWS